MTMMNLRVDEKDKKDFNDLCNYLGLSMTTALNMFIKQSNREKRLSLDLNADPFYSDSNVRYLEKKLNNYNSGELKLETHALIDE